MDKTPSRLGLPETHLTALPWLREELEEQRDLRTAQLAELSRSPGGDIGAEGARDEVAEARAGRVRETLAEIANALVRMDEGDYGICQGCSNPIPLERLEVMPHTSYCVKCGQRTQGR